jgi:hypothetical protein
VNVKHGFIGQWIEIALIPIVNKVPMICGLFNGILGLRAAKAIDDEDAIFLKALANPRKIFF